MNRNVSSSRTPLRHVFVMAVIAITLLLATVASADPPKKNNVRLRRALIVGGNGAFVLGYGYAAGMGGFVYRTPDNRIPTDMFFPVAGPYMALAQHQITAETFVSTKLVSAYLRNQEGPATFGDAAAFMGGLTLATFEYMFLVVDPIAQGFGLATAATGSVLPDARSGPHASSVSNPQWAVAPAWSSGPGVSLSITSW